MDSKLFILVFCACLQLGAVISHPQRATEESAEFNLQQQQQESDEDGAIQFQRNINQRPVIIRNQLKEITDACLEPRRTGRCKAHIPKYFFNTETGQCQRFTYGGCGGNGNNFDSLAACELRCSSHLKKSLKPENVDSDEICAQAPFDPAKSTSACRAYLPRWFYNATLETCTQFIYKGCGATPNLFQNRISCQETCGHYRLSKVSEIEERSQDLSVVSNLKSKVCELEMNPGPCYGISHRFYYNKENGRCQAFVYGGCGGNDNNFQTDEECVRSCGGTTPSLNTECAGVSCPWNLYTHYTTMDCKPIYDGQSCCPTRFDCPANLNQTATNAPTCKYNGKHYQIGEQVTEASSNSACRAACTCYGSGDQARINCASIECPENLGAIPPGKRNCQKLYKKGDCCVSDYHCANDSSTAAPYTCSYEGQTYVEGERIYPSTDECQTCLCQRGFNGTLSKEFCEKIDCGIEIYYADQLSRGCSPVYFRNTDGTERCCPIGWECPDEQELSPPPQAFGKPPVQSLTGQGPTPVVAGRTVTADVCSLNQDSGPCKASRARHFFNTTSQKCEKFIYGGCDGNGNNFVVLKDCQNVCESRATENTNTQRDRNPTGRTGAYPTLPSKTYDLTELDACTQPMKKGVCKGFFPRYYFSAEENRCKSFIYGGCRGNKNNFHSAEACAAVCQNIIPPQQSLTRVSIPNEDNIDNTGDSSRVNFEEQKPVPDLSQLVVVDITNRSLTEGSVDIDVEDPCAPKPETGRCKGHIRRYYFDTEAQYCKRFVYGGCGGNRNNFERLKECDVRCSPNKGQGLPGAGAQIRWRSIEYGAQKPEEPTQSVYGGYTERCNLPLSIGSCKATVKAYYFNAETQTCQNFTYSGCFGNANRFSSFAECESACRDSKDIVDSTTSTPVFSRSGSIPASSRTSGNSVGGRRERPEKLSVEDQVQEDKGFCSLPATPGNCRGHNLRYYFHADLKQCLPFVYTGCRGNKNNFLTESDCISACSSESTIEQITQEGVLTCSFGNETIPIGGRLGGVAGADEPCGVPLCQCLTPPSLTCVQVQCPPPPPPQPSPLPCPIPGCGPNCKPSIRPDNGCPTCDCEEGGPGFQAELIETTVTCKGSGCAGVKNVKG